MLNKLLLIFISISIFYACSNKTSKNEAVIIQEKKSDTLQKYVLKINEKLSPKAKVFLQDWGEYQRFNDFLEKNHLYTPEESLLNSKELAKLAQELKDSIRIEELQTPGVMIRLNVIHNESLRLEDMSEISVITEEEIQEEYGKIYEAFSALNSKINNKLDQDKLNEELKSFIDEIAANDSLNTNTVIEEKPTDIKKKPLKPLK